MNWLIISLNIAFALIATLLCALGWSTLKSIRHLNMGKSFWIPVFVSGTFFSIGSLTTIINEAGFSLLNTNEIVQIAQLIALCFLSGGIYLYSRNIKRNLSEELIIPKVISTHNDKIEMGVIPSPSIYDRTKSSNNQRIEATSGCTHQFGYLSTFPITASLPEECLSCDKIMECKHS